MTHRLTRLRQRILLPLGAAAVAVGAVGDGLLHSGAVFAAGFAVATAAAVAMAVSLYAEMRLARPEFRTVRTFSAGRDAS